MRTWTLIDWDGNASLNLKCWRKSFRRGHVSVGVGDFTLICYSYGADSADSISSTRMWPETERETMARIDSANGLYQ